MCVTRLIQHIRTGERPRDDIYLFVCVTWLINVWHDSFIQVTCLIHTCDMPHSYVWHDSFSTHVPAKGHVTTSTCSYVWHDSSICVAWIIHKCDMPHSYVWHASFICVTWLIQNTYTGERPRDDVNLFVCVTWFVHMCDSFIHVTWLNHMRDMTHSTHTYRRKATWRHELMQLIHLVEILKSQLASILTVQNNYKADFWDGLPYRWSATCCTAFLVENFEC